MNKEYINPVASTVCKTLYMLFNPSVDKEQIKNQLLQLCEGFDAAKDYTIDLSEQRKELAGWFEKDTFNEKSYYAKHLFRSSRIDVCDNINPFGSKMNYLKITYVGS